MNCYSSLTERDCLNKKSINLLDMEPFKNFQMLVVIKSEFRDKLPSTIFNIWAINKVWHIYAKLS